jgi:DNA polymerase (family 10)
LRGFGSKSGEKLLRGIELLDAAGGRVLLNAADETAGGLDYMRYGVGTAQRGWLTPDHVINTWPLPRLREFLRKGR